MNKILFLFLLSFLLCSCESDLNIFKEKYRDSELWFTVDNKIDNLDITFETKSEKGKTELCKVLYRDKKLLPCYGHFTSAKDGKNWSLVCYGQKVSGDISITYNGKNYKTRGFNLGERRYIEVVLTYEGGINIINYDITQIEKIVEF